MNIFKVASYRISQFVMNKIGMPLIKFPEPKTVKGPASYVKAADILAENGYKKPLIVADPILKEIGKIEPLTDRLEQKGLKYSLYFGVEPNPTFDSVLPAIDAVKENGIDSIIAFGGGSAIDVAKIIGACVSNGTKDISSLRGLFKVKKKYPCLIAIPTTAGTGSEATVAAVIIDPKTRSKYAVNDPKLVPDYAILDETLLESLPPKVIAATGMDALTHAVEAYIGNALTRKTKKCALYAINIIYHNLIGLYQDPHNLAAGKNMIYASYLAGVAFTRSYVGYVHALAHAIGGKYNVPHGYANAVLLPYVLEAYGKKAHRKLGDLAKLIEIVHPESKTDKAAKAFIDYVKMLKYSLGIPAHFDRVIKKEDLDDLVKAALHEANPLYPVPKILGAEELKAIYKEADPSCK
ncbi:MAG: iron-containing alcohol dehydrogenase [Bacilli bacterium]|nr:iron-containing alcohol dehydrogenase [Bacilli bacterium]